MLNRCDSVIFILKYTLQKQLILKAGADEKQVEILNGYWSGSLLGERGDLTLPRRHRERQQKRFAKDAPR